jgi:hypothetical protein
MLAAGGSKYMGFIEIIGVLCGSKLQPGRRRG